MGNEQMESLEKRVAALEQALQDGKKELEYIVDTWQETILQFAQDFAIDNPKLREISQKLKQKE